MFLAGDDTLLSRRAYRTKPEMMLEILKLVEAMARQPVAIRQKWVRLPPAFLAVDHRSVVRKLLDEPLTLVNKETVADVTNEPS